MASDGRKGIAILGTVLAVLAAAVALWDAGGFAPGSAQAQEQDETARVRELAERLLLQYTGSYYTYPGAPVQQPSIRVLTGQLPQDFPVEMPVLPGGRLLGSVASGVGDQTTRVEAVLDAPGSPREVVQFYEGAFAALGWTTPPSASSPYSGGGFVPDMQPMVNAYFCQGQEPDSAYISLTARPLRDGWTDVRLTAQLPAGMEGGRGYGGGMCSGPPTPPSRGPYSESMPRLPTLFPPQGVPVQSVGQSGGSGFMSTTAIAQTEMSPAQLEAHFARQLGEAGWVRVGGSATGGLAWSSWQVPEEGEWHGLLMAIEMPGENRRALSAWVLSASDEQVGPGGARGYYGYPYYTGPTVAIPPAPPAAPDEPDRGE